MLDPELIKHIRENPVPGKTGFILAGGSQAWGGLRGRNDPPEDSPLTYRLKLPFVVLSNIFGGRVASQFGAMDYVSTDASACASGLKVLFEVQNLMNNFGFDRMIVLALEDINHTTLEFFGQGKASLLYKDELAKLGKPLPKENPYRIEIYCAKDRATAMQLGAPFIAEKYKAYAQWETDKAMPEHERINKSFDELVEGRFVIGSPEDCWNQLQPYITELGVTHFVFRTHFLGMPLINALSSIRLISDELLPALHATKPVPLERITSH